MCTHGALVAAWYGSTDIAAGARVMVPLIKELRAAFPDREVTAAITSPRVRDIIARRDPGDRPAVASAYIDDVLDAVGERDATESGCAVLPLLIAEGPQMTRLREVCGRRGIRVGGPLIADRDDAVRVARAICGRYPARAGRVVLFVGHGSGTTGDDAYRWVAEAASAMGRTDVRVCLMGDDPDPTLPTGCDVLLVPLMLVAGTHMAREIAGAGEGSLRSRLSAMGYQADAVFEGIGELPDIQELAVDHTRALLGLD
ncbi:MAG: sirohydrochlorin cobaltochelatase [Olegusella sp.]|nr:sirohydrochlorin cobaltochelatase [Olegusella sp.]